MKCLYYACRFIILSCQRANLQMIFFLDRDQLVRYKFRWTDMEQMPMDNKLNKEEFLAFRHPEQSKLSMVKMVETIINSLGIFRKRKSIFRTITYEPAIKQIAIIYKGQIYFSF